MTALRFADIKPITRKANLCFFAVILGQAGIQHVTRPKTGREREEGILFRFCGTGFQPVICTGKMPVLQLPLAGTS